MKYRLQKTCAGLMLFILLIEMVGCAKNGTTDIKDNPSSNKSTNQTAENVDDSSNFDSDSFYVDNSNISSYEDGSISATVTNIYQRDDADVKGITFKTKDARAGKGGADKEAASLREKIVLAKDNIKVKGKAYYFSPGGNDNNDGTSPNTPFRSLDMLRYIALEAGDGIFLERGSVFRITSTIECSTNGITFAAYGEGSKPQIWGSEKNFAGKNLWRPHNIKNVWIADYISTDVGLLVFDYGEKYGAKQNYIRGLQKDLDFCYDTNGQIYLYSTSNPNTRFKSIEVGANIALFYGSAKVENIIIDNISFKLTSGHAIAFGENAKNVSITNCEIGWIGGGIQNNDGNNKQQYGNAIEFFNGAENVNVENCWIYQTFDAAVTIQGYECLFKNINIKNNLLEYNAFNIEWWVFGTDSTSGIQDLYITDNIMRYAGYSQGHDSRMDAGRDAHLVCGSAVEEKQMPVFKNYVVSENIFDCAFTQIIIDFWTGDAWDRVKSEYNFNNNTYYMKNRTGATWPYTIKNGNLILGIGSEKVNGKFKFTTASTQSEFEAAIKTIEKNAKLVKLLND